jgi:hypothetical protein
MSHAVQWELRRCDGPRKNRTLTGPVQFVGAGPTSPSRGEQLPTISVAIWEDGRQFIGSDNHQYDERGESDNTERRMPAMRVVRGLKCQQLQG